MYTPILAMLEARARINAAIPSLTEAEAAGEAQAEGATEAEAATSDDMSTQVRMWGAQTLRSLSQTLRVEYK